MKNYFSMAIVGISLSMGCMQFNNAYATTAPQAQSDTIKITANLKGTVKYQSGGKQQDVPAILTFGDSRGSNAITITDFQKTPSLTKSALQKLKTNKGGYKLTNEKGEPIKYADALTKKISGVKESGGYAIVEGSRIQVWLTVLSEDGKTQVPFVNWIGVDNLKELILINPPKNSTGGFLPSVKVVYDNSPAS